MPRAKIQSRKIKRYGWRPDLPGHDDRLFAELNHTMERAMPPPSVDLRKTAGFMLPDCYDQGDLGSCTANGTGFCWQFALLKENRPAPMPCRLFIYYNERAMEGTIKQDSGAQIRDGVTSLEKQGCTDEKSWPYKIKKFAQKPPASVYSAAAKQEATNAFRVTQDLAHLRQCLADGFPITFGFTVYESFESDAVAKSGIVPMPVKGEQVLGGHCVALVGYDDASQMFLCRNSWGTGWGQTGYFQMPYAYVTSSKLASDFWTVRSVAWLVQNTKYEPK